MTPPLRIAMRLATPASPAFLCTTTSRLAAAATARSITTRRMPTTTTTATTAAAIHTTPASPATVSPIHGTGPPPEAPKPAADSAEARLERRKQQAALLQRAQDMRDAAASSNPQAAISPLKTARTKTTNLLRKRFWKDVHVREVDGAYEVHLDARPLRRPDSKEVVRLPLSKPLLATALAVEWDMLVSAQQATRQHLIPLTSLVCRALDIADDDRKTGSGSGSGAPSIRAAIARTVLRYFDTDTLLCWAPPPKADDTPGPDGLSLRDTQKKAAEEVIGFLNSRVWPGVELEPVLDEETIMPRRQSPMTRQIVEGWVMGLNSWELAGLERGVLAGKGLLGAARLVAEWSDGGVGAAAAAAAAEAKEDASRPRYGVEEAVRNASIEVRWQTGRWGEVEDTHDVEKEDLARQFGSVVLLVGGAGSK
ncbi:uncharacterized protein B0I36DRAFT_314405 [Microdochium trichocladiopsis]|uniref:Protein atp12, mitochondrial n=1 Tax=Microdochium trichocladiopsis TaxID=1682393 RepID=A0A9P8YGN0_9PEZI|nr:uncharacterized protein B0I36DRAFT_314405 [Microdochium trichocladiopsis]KAH7037598.1 hypothetical protein B0I36DRAFT_314405 [Microdochium trichocladiopsis]